MRLFVTAALLALMQVVGVAQGYGWYDYYYNPHYGCDHDRFQIQIVPNQPAPVVKTAPPTVPTTAAPVTLSPQAVAFFNTLALLPALLLQAIYANVPTTTVPLPNRRRAVSNEDECATNEVYKQQASLYVANIEKTNYAVDKSDLATKEMCVLKYIAQNLSSKFGTSEALDASEKFMIIKGRTPTKVVKKIYIKNIEEAVTAKQSKVSKRQVQSEDDCLQKYKLCYVTYITFWPDSTHAYCSAKYKTCVAEVKAKAEALEKAAREERIKTALGNIFNSLLPVLGSTVPANVAPLIFDVYNQLNSFSQYLSQLAKAATFTDTSSLCYVCAMILNSNTWLDGYKDIIKQVYIAQGCGAATQPATTVANQPAQSPTQAATNNVINTYQVVNPTLSAIATTAAPASQCGVSNDLARLNNVGRSGFFVTARIVGGIGTGSCKVIPWQVWIKIGDKLCGGSILDKTHILTAAHCVYQKQASVMTVTAGDYNLQTTGEANEQASAVKKVVVHENYNPSNYVNDVAVLELSKPLDFNNECITPICINPNFDITNKTCTVSGWGKVYETATSASTVLQKADLPVYQGKDCLSTFNTPQIYSNYISNPATQLCAGFKSGGVDSCQGDSGGPLACYDSNTQAYVQVGIVSYGYGCARAQFPGVYTNVMALNQWITNAMTSTS